MFDLFDNPWVQIFSMFILPVMCVIGILLMIDYVSDMTDNLLLEEKQTVEKHGEVINTEIIVLPIDEIIINEAKILEKGWNFIYKNTKIIEVPRTISIYIIVEGKQNVHNKIKFDITNFEEYEKYKKGDLFPLTKTTYKYKDKIYCYYYLLD